MSCPTISGVNSAAAVAPLSVDRSPRIVTLPDGQVISTSFVYQSVAIQNAANRVYIRKSTIDAQNAVDNPIAPKQYTFRSDYERMQFIIGKRGVARGASGYQ
jgi:hypothetical protein